MYAVAVISGRRENSQCKIICILSYTKITKSDKLYSFEIWTIHYCQIHIFIIFVYPIV
jgi:hypothetical protein